MALCIAIPIFTLGGAIPYVLGCGGGLLCYAISSDGKGSESRRALLCVLVSLACWIILGGLVLLVESNAKTVDRKSPSGITRTRTTTDASGHSVTVNLEPARPGSSVATESQNRADSPQLGLPYPHAPIQTVNNLERSRKIETINATAKKVLSEQEKRKIYAKAARSRASVRRMQQQISERRREGKSTDFHEKQLAHISGMHESHLEFSTRFNKISTQELEAIIREGDSRGWPQE